MWAGQIPFEPVEEPGDVGRGYARTPPVAGDGLEVPHSGSLGHLLEPRVADLSVDRVGGPVAGVSDHRLEQRPGPAVEGQTVAIEPPQLRGEQKGLADACGAELPVVVVAAQTQRAVDDRKGDITLRRGEMPGPPYCCRRRIDRPRPDPVASRAVAVPAAISDG